MQLILIPMRLVLQDGGSPVTFRSHEHFNLTFIACLLVNALGAT